MSIFFSVPEQRALAQAELLPPGIGLFQLGQRRYDPLNSYYDGAGEKHALGHRLTSHLTGSHLATGRSGADLKRLATELDRYKNPDGKSLAKDLDLGRVNGQVNASVESKIYGLAYGLHKRWTIFAGIPHVTASVDAELQHDGYNNADAVRQQLGDLAYDELQDGLIQAGQISTAKLYEQIGLNGYQSIDHWEKTGIGDLRLGAKTGFRHPTGKMLKSGLTVTTTALIPTGYVEQPDILTDISFGTGYYSLNVALDETMTWRKKFQTGVSSYGQYNQPTTRKMRVPEDTESMVKQDRETSVRVTPGHDFGASAFTGWDFGLIDVRYNHGFERHLADRFSGDLEGNYGALSQNTGTWKHYHEGSVRLDTVEAFQRKKFVYPMHLSLHHRRLIEGINATYEKYFELRLTGFFSTPR